MTGTVESRYLDTFNGILALERDKATVNRLTLRHTGPGQGEAGATKRPGRGGRERRGRVTGREKDDDRRQEGKGTDGDTHQQN